MFVTGRMVLVSAMAWLAGCAATPAPTHEPLVRCHEIPNDLVECEVIEQTDAVRR